jgi:hypothetical protein
MVQRRRRAEPRRAASVTTRRLGRRRASARRCAPSTAKAAVARHLRIAHPPELHHCSRGSVEAGLLCRSTKRWSAVGLCGNPRPRADRSTAVFRVAGIKALGFRNRQDVGTVWPRQPSAPSRHNRRGCADIEHAVDRAGAAEHSAARPVHRPVADRARRLGIVIQLTSWLARRCSAPAGTWIIGCQSVGPASTGRLARHPRSAIARRTADPAPMIT